MRRSLLSLITISLVGCNPAMPTEQAARSAFGERESALNAFEADLQREIMAAGLDGPEPDGRASADERVRVHDTRARARRELAQRFSEASRADRIGALGYEVVVGPATGDRNVAWLTARVLPCSRSAFGRNGGRAAAEGIPAGDGRLGWGLYQTAWATGNERHGDGSYHPGIAVQREYVEGPYRVSYVVCFLLDGTPRPR